MTLETQSDTLRQRNAGLLVGLSPLNRSVRWIPNVRGGVAPCGALAVCHSPARLKLPHGIQPTCYQLRRTYEKQTMTAVIVALTIHEAPNIRGPNVGRVSVSHLPRLSYYHSDVFQHQR